MDPSVSSAQHKAEGDMCFANLEHLIEQAKDDDVIRILNANPSLLKIVDASCQTLLHVATKHKNLVIMEYLLEAGCDIEAKTDIGQTPLMYAAGAYPGKKDARATELLLSYDADIFITNLEEESALLHYLYNINLGDLPVEAFYEKAKDTTDENLFGMLDKANCGLHALIHLRRPEIVKMYLNKRGSLINIKFLSEHAGAMIRCMKYNYEENLRVFLHYDVQYDHLRLSFIRIFVAIVPKFETSDPSCKNIAMFVRLLIELVEFLNQNEVRAVDKLFLKSNEMTLRELLQADLNSFVKKRFGYEPLAYVFGNSKPGIFNLIQKEKIDINLRGANGETTLQIAFENKAEKYIKYLLEKNLDPNMTDDYGNTSIFFVFVGGLHSDFNACIKLLLKYNADVQICNNEGKIFIEYFRYLAELRKPLTTIFAHLAILRSCDLPIKAPFIEFLNNSDILAKFYRTACQQLDKMKTHKIDRSLTLFAILTKNYDFISHHVRTMHPDTIKFLCSSANNSFAEYNDYYTDIIRDRLTLAYKIYQTRKAAANVIYDCIHQLKGQLLVVDKICTFISYKYLHKIVFPSHEVDCKICEVPNLNHYQLVK